MASRFMEGRALRGCLAVAPSQVDPMRDGDQDFLNLATAPRTAHCVKRNIPTQGTGRFAQPVNEPGLGSKTLHSSLEDLWVHVTEALPAAFK